MANEYYIVLAAFVVVARERSSTRAAAKLGISTLGLTVPGLEERVEFRIARAYDTQWLADQARRTKHFHTSRRVA